MANTFNFVLHNLKCASCVNKIEISLQAIRGVEKAEVNFASKELRVTTDETIRSEDILKALKQLGYSGREMGEDQEVLGEQLEKKYYKQLIAKTVFAGLIGVPLFFLGTLNLIPPMATANGYWINVALLLITLIVLIYSAGHIFVGAWKSIRIHNANMDTLIAVGTGIAWLYSLFALVFINYLPDFAKHVYFEAATVIIFLVNLGALLEMRARRSTSNAIKSLLKLQPKMATVIRDEQEMKVPVDTLEINDIIRVKPGEQVPVDGVVLSGTSYIDESMLTGEPIPKDKKPGDEVIGGTMNKSGSFIFQAHHVGKKTVLAQIIEVVQRAQGSKPPLARLADKISAIFVPVVLIIAIVTALIWFNVGVEPRIIFMLVAAMSVLVIACPCALGLAVPISVMLGIGKAASYGILIRNAEALQQSGKLSVIVFDKTGTITEGRPHVIRVLPLKEKHEQRLVAISASIEVASEHPLAEAVVTYAKEKGYPLLPVNHFTAITGRGVQGVINNETFLIGNRQLLTENNVSTDHLVPEIKRLTAKAETPLFIARGHDILGIITISDPIKPDSKDAIDKLKKMGLKTLLLTGDNTHTAKAIAAKVGIDDVIAEVLPQDKAAKITELQAKGEIVGMVGDGINDAPALAQADVGFAIGTGSHIAIESGAITLMSGSLSGVYNAIILSKKTIQNMKQNLFGAFIYNVLGIPIAAGILYPFIGVLLNPMIAGAAMALSSVTVVMNANRLIFMRPGDDL